jgi:hypothetical protein
LFSRWEGFEGFVTVATDDAASLCNSFSTDIKAAAGTTAANTQHARIESNTLRLLLFRKVQTLSPVTQKTSIL